MRSRERDSVLGDIYDRTVRALHGLPDVVETKAATLTHIHPVTETVQTFIVQTMRHREQGDTILVQWIAAGVAIRIPLPPSVADCIMRQRDALGTKNRKRAAKNEAMRRKAAGIKPGFMRPGTKRGTKKKKTGDGA